MPHGKSVLLIVTGGIAAYKTLDLVRRLKERGVSVRCVLTPAAAEFVAPLAFAAVSGLPVHTDLFSAAAEGEMGHIRLAREPDLIVVAPATADFLAKAALGIADSLAGTILLATDRPILMAPAMNPHMWAHPATRANAARLAERGVAFVGPNAGEMAEAGEAGLGRMAEPSEILGAVLVRLRNGGPLAGVRALVTSGPTWEAIDPVRYLANRSSGKQGYAIAEALAELGAATTVITGPTRLADPPGVEVVAVESARDMLAACRARLPVDVAVMAAAVADWRPAAPSAAKIKKRGGAPPAIALAENPDILAAIAAPSAARPRLVVGFAAETENVVENARRKRAAKGCDWVVANDVSPATGTLGGDTNAVHLIGPADAVENWPRMAKRAVAEKLAQRIAEALRVPGDGR